MPVPSGQPSHLWSDARVVVAAEVGNPEVEVRERVRAVHEHVHAARVRHVGDLPHRQDVSGDVDHVRHHQQPRARRDGASAYTLHDLVVRAADAAGTLTSLLTMP